MRIIPSQKTAVHFFTLLLIFFVILMIPSIIHTQTPAQMQATVQQNNIQSSQATATSIFNNNLFVAGLSLIPYVGWGYLIFALWNTGTVVASYGQSPLYIFGNAFAWIELSVYTYMILKSYKLVKLFRQRKTCFTDLDGKCVIRKTNGVWNEIVYTAMYALIAASIVLLLSAVLEYAVISRVVTL